MDKLMEKRIDELRAIKEKLKLGGGQAKIDKVHGKGKFTAGERVEMLFDPGSVIEFGAMLGHDDGMPGDGIIAGHGTINGKTVCFYCQDPTVKGGSIGIRHGYKMYVTVERAIMMKVPFIGIHDSPGARMPTLTEGAKSAFGADASAVTDKHGGSIFFPNTKASGYIPQISVIFGNCAGISVYSPALNDFIIMSESSNMYITGARIVKSVMNEDITGDELGGSAVHCQKSGVADLRLPTEQICFDYVKELISYLPSSCEEDPPQYQSGDDPNRMDDHLADIVPSQTNVPFDMREVIKVILDNNRYFEIKPEFAREMTVGFGRLDGKTVGIVGNNSIVMAGSLTVDCSDKQARFIRFCDCFNIPLIFFVDTSAYLPGSDQEHKGIIRHGAKVLYALCEATVPRIAVIIRKAYGGGNLGMGVIPGLNTDLVYNWPIAEAGILGPKQAVNLFYANDIMTAENPEKVFEEKLKEYQALAGSPFRMANDNIFLEDMIEPRETRRVLINGIKMLKNKEQRAVLPKKHGNIPL